MTEKGDEILAEEISDEDLFDFKLDDLSLDDLGSDDSETEDSEEDILELVDLVEEGVTIHLTIPRALSRHLLKMTPS